MEARLLQLYGALSCCSHRGDQHSHFEIREAQSNALLRNVKVKVSNSDWFVFTPDSHNNGVMSPLLTIGNGFSHHRSCDAILLRLNDNGNLDAYYFDLKSGNPIGYSGQFKSSRQFVRYLVGLYNEFNNDSITIVDEKYIIFYGGEAHTLRKRGTRATPKDAVIGVTAPDNACKIRCNNGDVVFFRCL